MSRSPIGLLLAVTLVGVGLAVCLGALQTPPSQLPNGTSVPAVSAESSPSPGTVSEPCPHEEAASATPSVVPQTEQPSPSQEAPSQANIATSAVFATPHPSITYQIQAPQDNSEVMVALNALRAQFEARSASQVKSPPTAADEPSSETPAETAAEAPLPSPERTAAKPQPRPSEAVPPKAEAVAATPPVTKLGDSGTSYSEIHFQNEDLRKVVEAISEQSGLNTIVSDSVQGTVTANFTNVDALEALDAILKSTGFLARQEGSFLYVGTAEDFLEMEKTLDQIGTRVYRPSYATATELQTLITPLLSDKVGFVSISSASEVGIAADESNAGGDSYAGEEVLLVRDYAAVLTEIDQIIADVDVKPLQVAIEATILSVKLDDETSMGVSFEFLKNYSDVRLGIGSPLNALPTKLESGGLEFAFLDSNMSEFIKALESVQDTNVIATPRVLVLNKHRAEVQIGKSDGYINSTVTETSTSQSVAFLDTGTILRLRPFISPDGMIRMEIHPELSTGEVEVSAEFTIPKKEVTQVTTNVMVRDGCTVIIGGLIREQLTNGKTQVPLLGSLPVVGPLFRSSQIESTVREEILILLTPHIVHEPDTCAEGTHAACEFHRRREVMAEKGTPFSRDHLSRQYFRLAQNAWAQGDQQRALRYAEVAVHFNPGNRAAIDLRSDIWMNEPVGGHTLVAPGAMPAPDATSLDEETLPPWVLQGLKDDSDKSLRPVAPSGKGTISKNITKPGGWR